MTMVLMMMTMIDLLIFRLNAKYLLWAKHGQGPNALHVVRELDVNLNRKIKFKNHIQR